MVLTFQFAVRSDKGLVRTGNEDSAYAAAHLLAVADGMGGHEGGEIASSLAISHMSRLLPAERQGDAPAEMREAILAGNAAIADAVDATPALETMGTTLTAVLLAPDNSHFVVANVGDSRTYLMREGELVLLTRDDSLVQNLLDEGRITAAEAMRHPHRSLVTKALTGNDALEPALCVLECRPGDRFLLCSDGLTDLVPELELTESLALADREEAADRLVGLALSAGGSDNVTVIVGDAVVRGRAPAEALPGAVTVGAATSAEPTRGEAAEPGPPDRDGGRNARPVKAAFLTMGVVVLVAAAVYVMGGHL
ncbi:PP2C family protein-serine/threonine phosphatase [Streptomyces tendae]|uniref:PP2C family protein-serine/threonine phosphatase n=1 Tax=Streptomyces tendae TaxID=1932 RepID=UPI0024939991|nr:protein phosphatase 2C domain-containing protein [Streptomyces tendae]